ncbi:hypothetical protein F5Y17DRAFT_195186 [Xylariaceae sp. FL0594]|nr:hypothetical protein F5Y17DRAFT_195186 [Xylariaceae sp. FL0594]
MFPIDASLLPLLTTRQALLVVDAQNDFLADDGALPAKIPIGLPDRIGDLANGFRKSGGEVIWVQTHFEGPRPVDDEQILVPDAPGRPAATAPVRGRRSVAAARAVPPAAVDCAALVSPEAFLSSGIAGTGPKCVRPGAPGTEMHPSVKQAVGPRDHVVVKSYYSAFKSMELLRLLRVRFVTELFICGSSTNVGVMATAIDAAMYGFIITIVEDCCGSRSMTQHRAALRQITSTTGCGTLSAVRVLARVKPQPDNNTPDGRVGPPHNPRPVDRRLPIVCVQRDKADDAVAPTTLDIQSSLEKLSLGDGHAAADKHAPPRLSQEQSPPALRPLAGNNSPRSKEPETSNPTIPDYAKRTEGGHKLLPSQRSQTSDQPELPLSAARQKKPPEEEYRTDSEKKSSNSIEAPLGRDGGGHTASPDDDASTALPKGSETVKTVEPMSPVQYLQPDESTPLCEGDTKVVFNILPERLAENIFDRIKQEVDWQHMSHQGGEVPRLVAVQGLVEADGSKPVYRHPSDESPPLLPFTPTVDEIRQVTEAKLGHPLNHVLIQLYRHGNDYISEHSDKTLDIVKGSFIANVSLGAERTMTLRTKRQQPSGPTASRSPASGSRADSEGLRRQVQRARLPHNSLFQMGLATNMRWMHSIRQDKRLARDKSPAELAYDGARISLTFRRIGTFLDGQEGRIWGQGAKAKTKQDAHEVINGQTTEAISMLRAFGRENQSTEFDWEAHYGGGFDVLHIAVAPRLFLSGDPVANMRVQMHLAELGINYARGSVTASASQSSSSTIRYVDNDESRTVVQGDRSIMLYLQKASPEDSRDRALERFEQGLALLAKWHEMASSPPDGSAIEKLLAPWEAYLRRGGEGGDEGDKFLAGPTPGLADFAFWPVLHAILCYLSKRGRDMGGIATEDQTVDLPELPRMPRLLEYYRRVRAREAVAQLLAAGASSTRS